MRLSLQYLAATAAVWNTAVALPNLDKRQTGGSLPDNFSNHPFVSPSPGDRRSPCPGLNTLANHGYLNRNGRGITRDALNQAFAQGFGVAQSVIDIPTKNAFSTCELVNGDGACPTSFDLSDLNLPHAFEHDASMSRQEYIMLYSIDSDGHTIPVDNHVFNRTMFADTLKVLGPSNDGRVVTVQNLQDIRIEREHTALVLDGANNFVENKNTIETEQGFVMAVMRPFDASPFGVPQAEPNDLSHQTAITNWWMFWFSREELPVALGWRKPNQLVENNYVTEIRSSIAKAKPTALPRPLPPNAEEPPSAIPVRQTPTPNKRGLSLPTLTDIPLLLPTAPVDLPGLVDGILHIPQEVYDAARAAISPSPTPLQPYDVKYEADDFRKYRSELSAYMSDLEAAAISMVREGKLPILARAEATPTPTAV